MICSTKCGFQVVGRHLSLPHDRETENGEDIRGRHRGGGARPGSLEFAAGEGDDGFADLYKDEDVALDS